MHVCNLIYVDIQLRYINIQRCHNLTFNVSVSVNDMRYFVNLVLMMVKSLYENLILFVHQCHFKKEEGK